MVFLFISLQLILWISGMGIARLVGNLRAVTDEASSHGNEAKKSLSIERVSSISQLIRRQTKLNYKI
jgi:hypothetical protein